VRQVSVGIVVDFSILRRMHHWRGCIDYGSIDCESKKTGRSCREETGAVRATPRAAIPRAAIPRETINPHTNYNTVLYLAIQRYGGIYPQ